MHFPTGAMLMTSHLIDGCECDADGKWPIVAKFYGDVHDDVAAVFDYSIRTKARMRGVQPKSSPPSEFLESDGVMYTAFEKKARR